MTQKFTAEEVRKIARNLDDLVAPITLEENIALNRAAAALRVYADTLSKQASPLSAFVNAPHDEKQWIGQQVAARVDEMMDEPADSGRVGGDLIGHPRSPTETRDEIEMFLRDAYAAGCHAAQTRSMLLAITYAHREAPKLRAALAAQGQGEPDPMEAIVQHCMVTEAVSPDSADPYGTISRVIDWHQANTASPAGVPGGLLEHLREALRRVENGHSPRRIPANPGDVDLALSEAIAWLEGRPAPFWVKPAAAPSAPEGDGGCEVNTAAAYLADLLRTLDDAFITRGSQLRNWTLHVNTFPPSPKESEMARCNCSPRCDVCGDGPCDCTCTKAEKMTLHDRVEFALRDAGFGLDESSQIATLAEAHLAKPAVTEGE